MSEARYQYEETRELVELVNDAAELVRSKGEAAFDDFRVAGSRWRQADAYVFVLDPGGNMLLHPDLALEGKNEHHRKDIHGKPIIRGLIDAGQAAGPRDVRGGANQRFRLGRLHVAQARGKSS